MCPTSTSLHAGCYVCFCSSTTTTTCHARLHAILCPTVLWTTLITTEVQKIQINRSLKRTASLFPMVINALLQSQSVTKIKFDKIVMLLVVILKNLVIMDDSFFTIFDN